MSPMFARDCELGFQSISRSRSRILQACDFSVFVEIQSAEIGEVWISRFSAGGSAFWTLAFSRTIPTRFPRKPLPEENEVPEAFEANRVEVMFFFGFGQFSEGAFRVNGPLLSGFLAGAVSAVGRKRRKTTFPTSENEVFDVATSAICEIWCSETDFSLSRSHRQLFLADLRGRRGSLSASRRFSVFRPSFRKSGNGSRGPAILEKSANFSESAAPNSAVAR